MAFYGISHDHKTCKIVRSFDLKSWYFLFSHYTVEMKTNIDSLFNVYTKKSIKSLNKELFTNASVYFQYKLLIFT